VDKRCTWTNEERGKLISLYPDYISCENFQKDQMPHRTVNQIYKKAGRLLLNRGKRWENIKTYHHIAKEQLAYFAGILDGEGYICINPKKLIIQIVNTDKNLIDWIHSVFGGNVVMKDHHNPKWKIQYTWNLSRKENIMALLSLVRHLLIVKSNKAEYLFEKYTLKEASNE
jgi:hypothetical protein